MKLGATLAGGALTIGAAAALVLTTDPTPAPAPTPVAKIASCEHRGMGHWDKHGGLEDDRFHRAKGERVTCHDDDEGIDYYAGKDKDPHDDNTDRRRADRDEKRDSEKDSPFHRRDTSVKPNLFDLIS